MEKRTDEKLAIDVFGFNGKDLAMDIIPYYKTRRNKKTGEEKKKLTVKFRIFGVTIIHKPKYDGSDIGEFMKSTPHLDIEDLSPSEKSSAVKNQIDTFFSAKLGYSLLDTEFIMGFTDYLAYLFKYFKKDNASARILGEYGKIIHNENFVYIYDKENRMMYYANTNKSTVFSSKLFIRYMDNKRKKDYYNEIKFHNIFSKQINTLVNDCRYAYEENFYYAIQNIAEDIITLSGNKELGKYDIEFYNKYFRD